MLLFRIKLVLLLLAFSGPLALGANAAKKVATSDLVKFTIEQQYDNQPPGRQNVIAVRFDVDKNWHFYADPCTAPGGEGLKVAIESPVPNFHSKGQPRHEPNERELANETKAIGENLPAGQHYMPFDQWVFDKPLVPVGQPYDDAMAGVKTNVLGGKFSVYVPFHQQVYSSMTGSTPVNVVISGALCSNEQCRMVKLAGQTIIKSAANVEPGKAKFELPDANAIKSAGIERGGQAPGINTHVADGRAAILSTTAGYSWLAAMGLAFLAGVILNIMPCVLPVIPLKVMSIFQHAKESKFRCVTLGLAFCAGILVFFACIAAANIILRTTLGSVFQWGDHFRNPLFLIGMALLMEVLAMVMFGIATVHVPPGMGIGTSKGGYAGSAGMGFLAALLSTPCSFAILTAAFAWAQTQGLFVSTIAIMVIGVGMAAPYAILISMPGLLRLLPRPGQWMEIFKQAMGFVLLGVAIWLISVLPSGLQARVLYYAVVLGLCVWVWGGWVHFDSPTIKKIVVRCFAVLVAIIAGWQLLPPGVAAAVQENYATATADGITWEPYSANVIKTAIAEGRPVLVDWTADWCLTCKAMEKTVLGRKDIRELIKTKNVLTVRADTTWATNKAAIDLQKVYNEPGVPVIMVFVSGKNEPVRLHGLAIGEELKKALEEVK